MRLIDADALIEKCGEWYVEEGPETGFIGTVKMMVDEMPTIKPEPSWIPFKFRPIEEDEKEMHPDWDVILEGELPEECQRIMITVKYDDYRAVYEDVFYDDDGSYLDSGYEIGEEAIAWTPMPEPYKGGES